MAEPSEIKLKVHSFRIPRMISIINRLNYHYIMGDGSSKYGSIKIHLEQYLFNPGEFVQGTINVVIKEQISPSILFLHFKGIEELTWRRNRGKNLHRYYNKNIISKTKYPLMTWEFPLPPGSFSITFGLILPPDLPGSFCFINNSIVMGIAYKIYVRLKGNCTILKDKVNIGIITQLPLMRIKDEPKIAKLVSLCCQKKGMVKLDVRWINDKFSNGVPIECILDIDNSLSLARVKSVTATVYCIMMASANSYYHKPFVIELLRHNYLIEIPPGDKNEGDEGQHFAFDLNRSASQTHLTNVHTVNGAILNCNFYLDFKLNLDISCLCCGDKPLITSIFFVRSQLKVITP